MNNILSNSIAEFIKGLNLPATQFYINEDTHFMGLSSIFTTTENTITWLRPTTNQKEDLLLQCQAACLVCNEATYVISQQLKPLKMYIVTDKPEMVFLAILKEVDKLLHQTNDSEVLIHPTAQIHKNAILGTNVRIGAFCIIGNVEIGDNTTILNNVILHDNVKIGNHCVIREFCSIGGQGFGFIKTTEGNREHMPHIGRVVIEDFVQIFPFSNVDKATLGTTKIGRGSKIDHYCHIGHNSTIGRNSLITAKVVTAGGVVVGDDCFIGVSTIIKESLQIGNGVTTGLGSVVTKNIPHGEVWAGNPARPINELKEQLKKLENL
jgi:UDP-3-O-[3-hydroxymyristoyl] glucosamine N-acyltransferase